MSHFLTCSNNPDFVSSLQTLSAEICNSDPHPARFLLLWGLKHWYSQTDESFRPDVSSFPEHMQEAIEQALDSQERIGWYQASKGFFSKQWSQLATQDLNHPTKIDENQGASRMRAINATYNHTSRIWKARNAVLHAPDDTELADIQSAEFAEIRAIHGNPECLGLSDRHMCHRSIKSLPGGSAATRRRWLRRAKRSMARQQLERRNQTLIMTFFMPTSTG
jgi:hypothetical protein